MKDPKEFHKVMPLKQVVPITVLTAHTGALRPSGHGYHPLHRHRCRHLLLHRRRRPVPRTRQHGSTTGQDRLRHCPTDHCHCWCYQWSRRCRECLPRDIGVTLMSRKKYLYIRLVPRELVRSTCWKSYSIWVAILSSLWVVAWVIASAIPVFNNLLGLIVGHRIFLSLANEC